MALWSNTDANTSAPKFAVASGLGVSASSDALYANTTVDAFKTGLTLGVFGVDANEISLANNAAQKPAHAGWVLRTVGTGGRAGRVQTEVIVAMGSMTGDGTVSANDNVVFANT
jgi:hypothetical protein